MTHPDIPPTLRGTYAGLGHEAALAHLVNLGITAVELLPVHQSVPEPFLLDRGLTNYWGYNTIGYFAPHESYSAAARAGRPGGQVAEFKAMVDALHGAGLEVILDVVFNHTAESNHLGPTLCFRGLDNPAYYHLEAADPRYYVDTTGCGNTVNAADPDRTASDPGLAALLARSRCGWTAFALTWLPAWPARKEASIRSPHSSIWCPRTRWCARPSSSPSRGTSVRPTAISSADSPRSGGSGTGNTATPCGTSGAATAVCSATSRIGLPGPRTCSPSGGRRPTASVNLITVHDGFTLTDLVSYDVKHNEANGEDNRDGTDDNRSWNSGTEGPTTDPDILALRARQRRAMLTTLLLSFGVPLLLGGDELGRTQQGNNNAYCQDNALTWFDWSGVDADLLTFTSQAGGAAPSPPGLPPASVPGRCRGDPTRLVHPRGHGHDDGRLGRPQRPGRRPVSGRRRRSGPGGRRQRSGRRRLPRARQRLVGAARLHHPAHPSGPDVARRDRHLRSEPAFTAATLRRGHRPGGAAIRRRTAADRWVRQRSSSSPK